MIDRISFEGDETECAKWVGYAKAKAKSLAQRNKKMLKLSKTITHHTKPSPDVDIFIRVQDKIVFIRIDAGDKYHYIITPESGYVRKYINGKTYFLCADIKKGGITKINEDLSENEDFPYQGFHECGYKATGIVYAEIGTGVITQYRPKISTFMKHVTKAYNLKDTVLLETLIGTRFVKMYNGELYGCWLISLDEPDYDDDEPNVITFGCAKIRTLFNNTDKNITVLKGEIENTVTIEIDVYDFYYGVSQILADISSAWCKLYLEYSPKTGVTDNFIYNCYIQDTADSGQVKYLFLKPDISFTEDDEGVVSAEISVSKEIIPLLQRSTWLTYYSGGEQTHGSTWWSGNTQTLKVRYMDVLYQATLNLAAGSYHTYFPGPEPDLDNRIDGSPPGSYSATDKDSHESNSLITVPDSITFNAISNYTGFIEDENSYVEIVQENIFGLSIATSGDHTVAYPWPIKLTVYQDQEVVYDVQSDYVPAAYDNSFQELTQWYNRSIYEAIADVYHGASSEADYEGYWLTWAQNSGTGPTWTQTGYTYSPSEFNEYYYPGLDADYGSLAYNRVPHLEYSRSSAINLGRPVYYSTDRYRIYTVMFIGAINPENLSSLGLAMMVEPASYLGLDDEVIINNLFESLELVGELITASGTYYTNPSVFIV